MRIARLLVVAVATLMMLGRYYQEWRRLKTITRLDGPAARIYYEKLRRQNDWILAAICAALVLTALGAVGLVAFRGKLGPGAG